MVTSECAKSTSNILLGTCIAPGLDRLSCNLLPMTDFFFFLMNHFHLGNKSWSDRKYTPRQMTCKASILLCQDMT